MNMDRSAPSEQFLSGGGDMGKLIRSIDWSQTPVGDVPTWPQSLRTAISIMLDTHFPMYIAWGNEFIQFYNDGYRPILGSTKHPQAMGISTRQTFAEIWDIIGPMFEGVMEGRAVGFTDFMLPLDRNGFTEECYFIFSYSPIRQENGEPGGVLVTVTETTQRVLGERRLNTLRDLADRAYEAKNVTQACRNTMQTLSENPYDIPFSLFYLYDQDRQQYILTDTSGVEEVPIVDTTIILNKIRGMKEQATNAPFSMQEVAQDQTFITQAVWPETPQQCYLLPITRPDQPNPYGALLLGISPRLNFDEKYKSFFKLIADHTATAIANVYAYEVERKRAEALLEINQAKTTFFSNISHEFRTPLTLMLGPLEELLVTPTSEIAPHIREQITSTYRNTKRLLRLVNTLLDFSRIESGRVQARYQPVALALFTADIASSFRSIIESAGIRFSVHCDTCNDYVYVDREMWEKVVLNLLSNAFKYTTEGEITVSLVREQEKAVLTVQDTGAGISAHDKLRVFERFYQVPNATGRSYEGSGIGLSLVNELVKLHQGTITVESEEGQGSTFTVSVPLGSNHLPQHQVAPDPYPPLSHIHTVRQDILMEDVLLSNHEEEVASAGEETPATSAKARILLVDDNADMRAYIRRLLEKEYHVETASDGKVALEKIGTRKPDLIISDIMMPIMNGVQLLTALKENPDTHRIPIILLSARAGEEAKIAGYDIGADDYLIKPFSAKELMARVRAHLKISRTRSLVEQQLRNVFAQSPVAITIFRGADFKVEMANELMLELWGKTREQVLNKPIFEGLPEAAGQGLEAILANVYHTGERFVGSERMVMLPRNGTIEPTYVNFVYEALREIDGSISGIIAIANEVTDLVKARNIARNNADELNQNVREKTAELVRKNEELQQQRDFVEAILDSSVDLIASYDKDTRLLSINKRAAEVYKLDRYGVLGKKLGDVLPQLQNSPAMADLHKALNGQYIHNKIYASVISGAFYENFLIPLRDTNNNVYGALSIAHDITNSVETADKLRQANAQLEKSNQELEQFAYIASHDLQEPLRKIRTFSELLEMYIDDKERSKNYLEKITSSAARMSVLIREVLNYSRLTGTQEHYKQVDLNTILEGVTTDLELLIAQKQAVIKSSELPVIKGIPLQLQQLFSNLIGNSLKFSTLAPVIEISSRKLSQKEVHERAMLSPRFEYIELTFKDNGIGFDQQYAEQIFTIFQRLSSQRIYSGTGIGLAVCKKIVDNHHGSITALSEQHKGATFIISLPIG